MLRELIESVVVANDILVESESKYKFYIEARRKRGSGDYNEYPVKISSSGDVEILAKDDWDNATLYPTRSRIIKAIDKIPSKMRGEYNFSILSNQIILHLDASDKLDELIEKLAKQAKVKYYEGLGDKEMEEYKKWLDTVPLNISEKASIRKYMREMISSLKEYAKD